MKAEENISLLRLVSTCVDACTRGCKVIRFVHNKRKEGTRTQDASSTIGVSYKVADDPRSALTEADLSSQQVITACLRDVWGDRLNIIGEEDTDEDKQPVADESLFAKYNVPNLSEEKVNADILYSIMNTRDDHLYETNVPLSYVTLYIDPMDGTREFVEGRIQNVQCLIGITVKDKPVGGVIGLPFVSFAGQNERAVNVVCAIKSGENCTLVENICLEKPLSSPDAWLQVEEEGHEKALEHVKASGAPLNVFTGDSQRVQKKHALNFLEKAVEECSNEDVLKVCITGGCGNKMLRATAQSCTSVDGNAICLIPPGTCSWDTAAPTALMMAAMEKYGKNGKITDFFGGELVYDSTGNRVTNDLGAIVSCGNVAVSYHDRLTNAMNEDGVILNSMLSKYWNTDKGDGKDIFSDSEISHLKASQYKPQAIGVIRNTKGYVMTSQEIEEIIKDLVTIDKKFNLLGYSTPREYCTIQNGAINGRIDLFWNSENIDAPKHLSYNRQSNNEIKISL